MKLYIKQHVFTWGDRFSVYDENGREKYVVQGEVFSFGKKLHVLSANGTEQAYIHQRVLSFVPKYYINRNGREIAEVIKHFTLFRQEYSVNGLGWQVRGDFFGHDYEVFGGGRAIARVQKAWLSWGDAYQIEIADGIDDVAALSVVIVIDAILTDTRN